MAAAPPMSNAVENLFNRLKLSSYYPAFQAKGVEKIITLRKFTESELQALIPDEEARQKLQGSLTKRDDEASRGRGGYRGSDGRGDGRGHGDDRGRGRGRGRGQPRDEGDNRGEGRFDAGRGGAREGRGEGVRGRRRENQDGEERPPREHREAAHSEDISVPWESIRLLLGNKAENLNRIHHRCGTSKSKIDRPEAYQQTFTFQIRGSKEGVKKAKQEIEHFVGIASANNREARFHYANHELERNLIAVKYAVAANQRSAGTALELSEASLKALIGTFRFLAPPKLTHFFVIGQPTDKDKFEIVTNLVKALKGVQTIVFTDANRVEEMAKRAKNTSEAFGVRQPNFVHRKLPKEERLRALEAFKSGEANAAGVKQRVLVTNDDYAKYARKVTIPYVNLVVHFALPRSKEIYLHQAMCAGRGGRPGISVMFLTHHDAPSQKEWSNSIPLQQLSLKDFESAAAELVYDTVAQPLTDANADPDSSAVAA